MNTVSDERARQERQQWISFWRRQLKAHLDVGESEKADQVRREIARLEKLDAKYSGKEKQ